jgi:hypothetical protein
MANMLTALGVTGEQETSPQPQLEAIVELCRDEFECFIHPEQGPDETLSARALGECALGLEYSGAGTI